MDSKALGGGQKSPAGARETHIDNVKNTDARLRKEIAKWTKKLEREMAKTHIQEGGSRTTHIHNKNIKTTDHFLKNIDAYLSDSKYFYRQGDLIRSFEAIIWAWSWWEILEEIGK
jgi:hypothetical protein